VPSPKAFAANPMAAHAPPAKPSAAARNISCKPSFSARPPPNPRPEMGYLPTIACLFSGFQQQIGFQKEIGGLVHTSLSIKTPQPGTQGWGKC